MSGEVRAAPSGMFCRVIISASAWYPTTLTSGKYRALGVRSRPREKAARVWLNPAYQAGTAKQTRVSGGKCVHLAQRSQRDVLCSPFADAGDRTESDDCYP